MIGDKAAISRRMKALITSISLSLCAYSCRGPQEEFLGIRVCLSGNGAILELVKIMRKNAHLENLSFVDRSLSTNEHLSEMRNKGLVKLDHVPTINIGIEGERGLGVTATNLGLPSNQVALGFTAGSSPARARRLSGRLVAALSKQWHVEKTPQGKGAFPMRDCTG